MSHSACATKLPAGECDCAGAVVDRPAIDIDAITKMADALIARSSKFKAFFSRAELEAHLVFGVWPVVLDLQKASPAARPEEA